MEPVSYFFLIIALLQVGHTEPRIIPIPVSSIQECYAVAKDVMPMLVNNTSTADAGFLCVHSKLSPNGNPKT